MLQDELYAARWVLSLLELFIVLAFLGHLNGCFFYFFSGPAWWTDGEPDSTRCSKHLLQMHSNRQPQLRSWPACLRNGTACRLLAWGAGECDAEKHSASMRSAVWLHPAAEKAAIDAGEMSTWLIDKIGNYRVIFAASPYTPPLDQPSPVPGPHMAFFTPTSQWYECPTLSTIKPCVTSCNGEPFRCFSVFGFSFRCGVPPCLAVALHAHACVPRALCAPPPMSARLHSLLRSQVLP